jgi:hypothetical protein
MIDGGGINHTSLDPAALLAIFEYGLSAISHW